MNNSEHQVALLTEINTKQVVRIKELQDVLRAAIEWGEAFEEAPKDARPEWYDRAKKTLIKNRI